MTTHIMNLQSPYFENICNGKKTIEVRLYDEKRKKIELGDVIIFQNSKNNNLKVETNIIGLLRYSSFKDLINDNSVETFGFEDKEKLLNAIFSFYSEEQEHKYGVLGIKIRLNKKIPE